VTALLAHSLHIFDSKEGMDLYDDNDLVVDSAATNTTKTSGGWSSLPLPNRQGITLPSSTDELKGPRMTNSNIMMQQSLLAKKRARQSNLVPSAAKKAVLVTTSGICL
jgi:hypothetical protein